MKKQEYSDKLERKTLSLYEQTLAGKTLDKSELITIYNRYSAVLNNDDAKEYTIHWLSSMEDQNPKVKLLLERIKKLKGHEFHTIGWISRLLTLGCTLPKESLEWRNKILTKLAKITYKSEEIPVVHHQTPEEKEAEQFNNLIGFIENKIDEFPISVWNPTGFFDGVKPAFLKLIIGYYRPFAAELNEVLRNPDAQLKEGYSHLKKSEVTRLAKFVLDIILTAKAELEKEVVNKKPRKRKQKTPEKMVAKLSFKVQDQDLIISSISPKEIIGAKKFWVYNCKTRFLAEYTAKSEIDGLSVRGTTITGFDEKLSVQKKLRKPVEILKSLKEAGKVTIRNFMKEIKTKESIPNGRVNSECLLIKAQK